MEIRSSFSELKSHMKISNEDVRTILIKPSWLFEYDNVFTTKILPMEIHMISTKTKPKFPIKSYVEHHTYVPGLNTAVHPLVNIHETLMSSQLFHCHLWIFHDKCTDIIHDNNTPQPCVAMDVNSTKYAVLIIETTYLKSQSLELFTHKLLRWLSVTWPGARLPLIGLLVLTFDPSVCCDMLTGVWTPGISKLFHSLLAQPQRQALPVVGAVQGDCQWPLNIADIPTSHMSPQCTVTEAFATYI